MGRFIFKIYFRIKKKTCVYLNFIFYNNLFNILYFNLDIIQNIYNITFIVLNLNVKFIIYF